MKEYLISLIVPIKLLNAIDLIVGLLELTRHVHINEGGLRTGQLR
jgi:hypothetical protein